MLAVKAGDNVVRLLPPLIVEKKDINEAIRIIAKTCSEF
jgi:acetylornithine/N-succinyldiaminopimelate aminotransferase